MSLYDKYVLPRAIHWACSQNPTMRQREKVIPLAAGRILEVGIGSGLNLPYYDKTRVQHLTAIDPSPEVWNQHVFKTQTLPFGFDFIEAFAEDMPVDSHSMDAVVITYTLCTIKNAEKALEEFRRVLKPSGTLIFCEHGKAPDKSVVRWQQFINPIWSRLGGGCQLTRDIPGLISINGFCMQQIDTMYIPGWRPVSFNYWGVARPVM